LLVPLAPFLLIGAAVVGALALAINTLTEIRKKFDQAPGILSKMKLIISAIITAPFTFLQKIGVFIAEKLGFTKFAEAFGSIDFIQVFMNFFSDIGAKIKGLFPASVFQFLDGLNIEEAIINKVTELRESLFGAIGNIFGNVGLGLTTLKNDILGFLADILEKFTFLGIGPKIAKFIRGATEEPEETTTPVEQRQTGGPVKQGGLYLVGEKGPELFKPNMGGMVANQAKTQNIMQTALDSAMSMMGGGAGQVTTTNVVNNMPKTETSNISVQSIDPITQDFNFRKLSTFAF